VTLVRFASSAAAARKAGPLGLSLAAAQLVPELV
jgi:hypothetical protein